MRRRGTISFNILRSFSPEHRQMWHPADPRHDETMHCNGQMWYWRLVCRLVESVLGRLFQFNAKSYHSLHQERVWLADSNSALFLITCHPFIDFRNIVDDVNCVSDSKPIGVQKCNISQVSECGPSWHYSEWSEVSVSCSFGYRAHPFKLFAVFPSLWHWIAKANG